MKRNPRFPDKRLVIGIILTVLGAVLLLRTTGYLPTPGIVWPVIFLALGIFLLYLVLIRKASEHYLFLGLVLTLGGAFFVLRNTVIPPVSMARIWPVFMLIIGLSMIPYGLRLRAHSRVAIIVPGIAITALSLLFLPFSLGLAGIGFRRFVIIWWPVLIVLLGIFMIYSHFRRSGRNPEGER